jgi:TRAP-type C4-dicarboxylate transport system permease small subunit
MKQVQKLERLVYNICNFVAVIGLIALVTLALATIFDVLFRWLLNDPIDGVYDLYKLIIAVVIGSFFPITLVEKHHISINFLGTYLGYSANKILNNFANSMLLAFLILVAWQLVRYVFELNDAGETTWVLQWAVAPWWGVATLCIIICVPVQLFVCIRDTLQVPRRQVT